MTIGAYPLAGLPIAGSPAPAVTAATGQMGAVALTVNNPAACVAQAGAVALTVNNPAACVAQAGAVALTVNNPAACVAQAGAVAFVVYQPENIAVAAVVPPAVAAAAGVNETSGFVLAAAPAPTAAGVAVTPVVPVVAFGRRDVALQYDQVKRRCDVVFDGRDFALDATPASAMLFSLLADRRAEPDDVLPDTVPDYTAPSTFIARRGWCGDCFDALGRLVGSRFWLLRRAKASEATRRSAETYVAQALSWLESERNLAVQVTVRWVRPGVLGILARCGKTQFSLTRALAA